MNDFSAELVTAIHNLRPFYPEEQYKSALLPALHLVQAHYGWLSTQAMDEVAMLLGISPIEVYEVASFYSMFHLTPTGKYVLEVCHTAPCCLVGAEPIIAYLEERSGAKVGGTSPDKLFTLKTVECLAACGTGPVLQIGPEYTYYENLTRQKVDDLLDMLRQTAADASVLV